MIPVSRVALSRLLALLAFSAAIPASAPANVPSRVPLHRTRSSAQDLEVGGDLTGIPQGETRFIRYADLLRLPQRSFLAIGDANFGHPVHLAGVPLELLPSALGAAPGARMLTALCRDRYKTNYPPTYLQAHHPILVLRVEGQSPDRWAHSLDGPVLGPYIIAHASFVPSFRVLSHDDEPQIPWGVVRLDLRREPTVYAGIQPTGPHASDLSAQQGYSIARQNCFRCHNEQAEGGFKAQRSWHVVARRSIADPQYFNTYVRTPRLLNPASQMAASPQYDAATLAALRAYFRLFATPSND